MGTLLKASITIAIIKYISRPLYLRSFVSSQ